MKDNTIDLYKKGDIFDGNSYLGSSKLRLKKGKKPWVGEPSGKCFLNNLIHVCLLGINI